MDAIREALAMFGNAWNNEVPPTLMKLYEPMQAKQNEKYAGQVKAEKAIKYGPDARNRLDVYTPVNPGASEGSGKPVVVFIHGGGLVGGDNNATPNIHANIGNYFTSKGCITCLVTYRLAFQGGHFPNGAEDVAAALRWVRTNISTYGGDPDRVVALGQSAGGHHLATAVFLGMLDPDPKPLLRGAILLSAALTTDPSHPSRAAVLKEWYNTNDVFEINSRWSPAALFRQQFFGTTTTAPRQKLPCELLMMIGEVEAEEILEGTFEFVNDYRKRFGKVPLLEVMKGHNHASYTFGLGLDEPEYVAVAERLLTLVKTCTA
ncbi:Pyrethroid hydrolase Ces2a [Cytospora mali]|uniref:Pyrethroid hydrolase Ces2a n=1 Tax=Cytospora mali TaxID=578113 RepID=A0A194VKP0_CYTMA|nr:Pyrethroid hydrolase Ces2a [Valsa mali]